MKSIQKSSLVWVMLLLFVMAPISFDPSNWSFDYKTADAKGGKGGKGGNSGDKGTGNAHGKSASSLGRLNAAHASATARENASSNSAVGAISSYEEAVSSGLQDATEALAEIANKEVDADVAAAVNDLLGVEMQAEAVAPEVVAPEEEAAPAPVVTEPEPAPFRAV